MRQEKIKRINELAKKKKEVGLTDAEFAEQKLLHQEYLSAVKRNAKTALEQLGVTPKKQENGK